MNRLALVICIMTMGISSLAVAATDGQVALLEQRATKAASSPAGEYAKILLDAAKASLTDAKVSSDAGKEKMAARYLELAEIQLNAAEARGAEKELLEKVAVRRSELKKMELRLERFRQGEEN